jgi:Spy/CpxP family protein refolding chaperone
MTTQPNAPPEPAPTAARHRRTPLIVGGLIALALAVAFVSSAVTGAFSQGYGPHWGGHGFGPRWGGPGMMMMDRPFDPAQAQDRVDRMVRHFAVEIDATADQQDKLRAIAKSALNDLIPLRDKARATHERARTLLTAPTVDRAAIEALRAEQMAMMDTASKRVAQALADAADVLTPDQRHKIDERIGAGRPGWGMWHRG